NRMSLYGQYHSSLLKNLRREDMHQYIGGEDYWLSVPYDANVGIFVVRLDLYQQAIDALTAEETKRQAFLQNLTALRASEEQLLERVSALCQEARQLDPGRPRAGTEAHLATFMKELFDDEPGGYDDLADTAQEARK